MGLMGGVGMLGWRGDGMDFSFEFWERGAGPGSVGIGERAEDESHVREPIMKKQLRSMHRGVGIILQTQSTPSGVHAHHQKP